MGTYMHMPYHPFMSVCPNMFQAWIEMKVFAEMKSQICTITKSALILFDQEFPSEK